jgi:uncharacterized LabA/DUF88 family protein
MANSANIRSEVHYICQFAPEKEKALAKHQNLSRHHRDLGRLGVPPAPRPQPVPSPKPSRPINLPDPVGIVVDVQNLFHSSANLHHGRVDFMALREAAASGRPVSKAIAYTVAGPDSNQDKFFKALRHCGFEIKVRPLQVFSSTGDRKGNWDVGIALDAYDLFLEENLKTIILVSGDGDFVDLIDRLHHRGGRCEVVSFRETTSYRLVQAADRYLDLSQDPKRFVISRHRV